MTSRRADFPRVEVASEAQLHRWLAANHRRSGSIWLVTWKKKVPDRYVPYDRIVDAALSYGWIDSLPRSLDEQRSMHLLSPRKPGSGWSKRNKLRAEALLASGRMRRAGRAAIERARADGSWTRLDRVETLVLPRDLAAALAAQPPARAEFQRFPPSSRRLILEWIAQARRPATRARRIAETAAKAARGERAHHYRQPGARRTRS